MVINMFLEILHPQVQVLMQIYLMFMIWQIVLFMTDGTKNNEYQLVSRKGGRPENETEE